MIQNLIFKLFIKCMYIFTWFSEWGGGPTFVTDPGSVSSLSGPGCVCLKIEFMKTSV
jgi:hypothetical protein